MDTIISVSILSADFKCLKDEIIKIEQTNAKMIHFDVMDGVFVNNISFGPSILKTVKELSSLIMDIHLMISNPIKYISEFVKAGADIITFHVEACDNVMETIDLIHSFGIKAGISIKPNTPIEETFPYLQKVENVLIMTVEPGFGGQGFIYSCIPKISEIKQIANESGFDFTIQVDGGINSNTAPLVIKAGATNVVSGSYILNASDIGSAVESIRITKN